MSKSGYEQKPLTAAQKAQKKEMDKRRKEFDAKMREKRKVDKAFEAAQKAWMKEVDKMRKEKAGK